MAARSPAGLEVQCEWGGCGFRGRSMEVLSEHMAEHLRDYLGDRDALEDLEEFSCLWSGCGFVSMGSAAELEVHAHFHTFLGKLRCLGSQLLSSRAGLPPCSHPAPGSLIPEGPEALTCQWEHCDASFNNPEWFYRHVDNHVASAEQQPVSQQQQALVCRWAGCDAYFKIRYRLREHLRSHTQERLVACPTCGAMFSSNTKLFDHLQRQAAPVESLVCQHCGKCFPSERLLRDHVRQHVNQVKCPLCDMSCTTLAALKIHIRFRHCDERPFACDFCDKRFKNQRDCHKHAEVHNEGAVYRCTVASCQYSCQTFQTLNYHYRRVHKVGGMSKYKCHLCGQVFSWCYTLTLHLRNKHQLKWPSGHSRFRYRKDVDGFLKLNMVRYETVEVTKEIMMNMAGEPQKLRKSQRTCRRKKPPEVAPESGRSSPAGSSSSWSSSSSSSSCGSSDLSAEEESGPEEADSPVYSVMNTVTAVADEAAEGPEDQDSLGTSGAVRALTEVARGLCMDVV